MSGKRNLPTPVKDRGENLAGEQVTEHIWRCPDGVYRWYYELDMLKNPLILFTTWKVLGIAFGVVYLFTLLVSAVSDSLYGWSGFLSLTGGFALIALAFAVIGVLAYLIVAGVYGWHYVVLFEMDDRTVRHIQVPRQFKKAEALSWLALLAGIAANQPTTAAAGMLSMTRNSSTSEFGSVKKLVIRPRRNLIRVIQFPERNQIYAAPEDFEFVREYIAARCTKARVR